ncbi:hypothetical protein FSP39_025127 [Pinctada imbricata]|uniref:Myosin motor domain-containing protein n=1 Tax=Pinctada imbricata TaxID=66713 RepID=A0AA88Y804_PINIB|nr:hypothetical protein FSP39_025127 [Pinctada imbricata]
MDQSVLDVLPLAQRQKVTRQLRQKQVEGYLAFIKTEGGGQGSFKKPRKANKKGTAVNFTTDFLLQDAVENFDDREEEDNVTMAELLLRHGADVNILDSDWWTPLHVACSCDSVEMVQFLLNNGADVTTLDVDGFFPIDHCSEGSESHQIVLQQMEAMGIDQKKHKELQLSIPRQMYRDVQNHVSTGGNVNKTSESGISLIHIACANGYRKVLRLLIKNGADVNTTDDLGWTPLHVAARFSQMKTVQSLLKSGADPLLKNVNNDTPLSIATADDVKTLLLKAERKKQKQVAWRASELVVDDEEDDEEDDGLTAGNLVRINSKTVRNRHSSLAKEDEILEAKKRLIYDTPDLSTERSTSEEDYEVPEEEEEEDVYVSKIWRNVDIASALLPAVMESDDLSNLPDISEASILKELNQRYSKGQIYTMIGNILMAVNPFKDLPLYSKAISARYHAKGNTNLPPHIYSTADWAHRCLIREQASQCCVISGESGSGKTESCKLLVQHLVSVAGSEESNLNQKISQVNPVLEAFGNARTVMNINSSRFAKYMELNFNTHGKITGARLTEYLLEKSRVVFQGEKECNFHIFYWLFSGVSHEEANLFHIKSLNKHRYLRQRDSDMSELICTANKEKFWELKECLKFIGFSQMEVQNIFMLLAALIHLGDITFRAAGNNDSAFVDNMEEVDLVSSMLELSGEELSGALTSEYTVTRGEQIKKERTVQQASDCRDALAKAIYSRLFSWIVNGINQMIQPIDPSSDNYQIGILDIFGFENFARNSFEQMCINVANEKMQSYTNEYIFQKEQQDCLQEGVPLIDLNYQSNQTILDAFSDRTLGVLAILDEESRFPKGTDSSLATKLHQSVGQKYPGVYKAPKDGGKTFTILHYAGAVKYYLDGVLEKNKDTLPNAVMYTMKTSNSLLIKEMFQSRVTRTGSIAPSYRQQRSRKQTTTKSPFDFFKKMKGGKQNKKPTKAESSVERKGPATMAFHFKNSLADLMTKVQSCKPHIVRCLRPNNTKTPMLFMPEYILAQLRYTGIAETIKIKKYGYSMRLKFHDFIVAYNSLYMCVIPSHSMIPESEKCKRMLQYCKVKPDSEGFKMGKTKVFLRDQELETLSNASKKVRERVIKAQAVARGYLARRRVQKLRQERRNRQEKQVSHTFQQLQFKQDQIWGILNDQRIHDKDRYETETKAEVVGEICKSLDDLETMLNEYVNVSELGKSGKTNEWSNDSTSLEDDYADVANLRTDMNGNVQYRGLPPPPCGAYIPINDAPPPSPREMYSHSGIYDVIPAQQNECERRAPAPPKRSPSTRLSTSSSRLSTSSTASDDMSEGHYHTHGSPSHTVSPKAQRRSAAALASPSHASKPFSYNFENQPLSPKGLRRASDTVPQYDGHRRVSNSPKYDVPSVSPGAGPMYEHIQSQPSNYSEVTGQNLQYVSAQSGSRQSPSHRPQSPGSPRLRRQSSDSRSPKLGRKNSGRLIPVDAVNPPRVIPNGPPSFPAPPPPVPVSARFVAAMSDRTRSPSPPLPPPPPELGDGSGRPLSPQTSLRQRALQSNLHLTQHPAQPVKSEPPTPPPISKIPGAKSSVSSFELGKKHQGSNSREESPVQSPTHHAQPTGLAAQLNKVKLQSVPKTTQNQTNLKSPSDVNRDLKKDALGIAAEIGQIVLKSTSKEVANIDITRDREDQTGSNEKFKLNHVKKTPAVQEQKATKSPTGELFLQKLRPTGGQKPWEKDMSPPSHSSDQSEMSTSMDDLPLPPPPPELMEELPPPPPAPQPVMETSTTPQTNGVARTPGANVMELRQMVERSQQKKKDNSSHSNMNLDEIDYSQIPGYVEITAAIPNWKRDMIEKKNKEKVDEYLVEMRRKQEEAEKWKDVPEWKRKLLEEKDKEKREKEAAMTQAITDWILPTTNDQNITVTSSSPSKLQHNQQRTHEQPPPSSSANVANSQQNQSQVAEQPPPSVAPNICNAAKPNTEPATRPPEPSSLTLAQQKICEKSNSESCQREDEERRRAEKQRQIELAAQMEREMADVPAWKREIMMKKGGNAPSNWGDEREDINRDDE